MAGAAEAQAPTYISLRSAEVILSDVRPVKLKVEALRSVNIFLDEFLHTVLNASQSISTEKLREGLLKALPTPLGKEALLEAEMELRAYWERTEQPKSGSAQADSEGKDFHLQWSFELLRLKCEAYSTLNDTDEDQEAEQRLNARMGQNGKVSPPKESLVAPAALYLTAILESVCEHVLSNVGRVAARDSSRTSASVQDLFVALCEDDSIYGLFKSMKVYEQIDNLSNVPKPRRSKSFSRSSSVSRTGSPFKEQVLSSRDPPAVPAKSRTRISSESSRNPAMVASNLTSSSRTSFEKSRAMKMFSNSRASVDHGNSDGHKRSDSILSESTKYTTGGNNDSYDPEGEEEFDNAMRNPSTMKMSLTPDRLRTMEVYNKEKGSRRPAGKGSPRSPANGTYESFSVPPSPANDLVDENADSGSRSPGGRIRQSSVSAAYKAPTTKRLRSISASSPPVSNRNLLRQASQEAMPRPPPPQKRDRPLPKQLDTSGGMPPRTRRVVGAAADMDLDDIMNGSDDDVDEGIPERAMQSTPERGREPPKTAPIVTPKAKPAHNVSSSTRELMDFLASGPPEDTAPSHGMDSSMSSVDSPHKGKGGGGRLQRMISKLRLNEQPKGKNGVGQDVQRSGPPSGQSPVRPTHITKNSTGNYVLANRPIPPRPPPMISPPSSPSQGSWDDHNPSASRPAQVRKAVPAFDSKPVPSVPKEVSSTLPSTPSSEDVSMSGHPNRTVSSDKTTVNGSLSVASPKSRKAEASPKPPVSPVASATDARDIRRMLANATSVDECRVLMDIFLAKIGHPANGGDFENPYPTHDQGGQPSEDDASLQHSLVELFLGGSSTHVTSQALYAAKPHDADSGALASPPYTPGAPSANGGADIAQPGLATVSATSSSLD